MHRGFPVTDDRDIKGTANFQQHRVRDSAYRVGVESLFLRRQSGEHELVGVQCVKQIVAQVVARVFRFIGLRMHPVQHNISVRPNNAVDMFAQPLLVGRQFSKDSEALVPNFNCHVDLFRSASMQRHYMFQLSFRRTAVGSTPRAQTKELASLLERHLVWR